VVLPASMALLKEPPLSLISVPIICHNNNSAEVKDIK
jgi:hypothetical protein